MNINDLAPGSYTPVASQGAGGGPSGGLNINSLPQGSYAPVAAPSDHDQVMGSSAPTGVLNTIANNTLGYNGIGGFVARPIVSAMMAGAEAPVANSNSQLAQVNTKLIQKLGTMSPTDPQYQNIKDTIAQNNNILTAGGQEMNSLERNQETQEQNVGLALNSLATLGSFAASPVAAGAKGAAAAAGRIATGVGFGAAAGAGQAMSQNASAGQVGLSTAGGAVMGGGLASLGELGSAIVDSLADRTPGGRLQTQTNNLKTLTNAVSNMKTNPVETITDLGTPLKVIDGKVNTDALTGMIDNMQSDINTRADQIIKNMPGTVNTSEFQSAVEESVKSNPSIRGAGGVQRALAKVQTMFDDYTRTYGAEMPYSAVNEIRTSMNRFFDPESVDLERAVANTARDYLYNSDTGSPELKRLMGQWGKLEDASDFAQKLSGTAVKGGRLGKYIADATVGAAATGLGTSLGGPLGGLLAGPASSFATDRLINAMQAGYFQPSMLSAPASTVSSLLSSPVAQTALQLGKNQASRSVGDLLSPSQGQ